MTEPNLPRQAVNPLESKLTRKLEAQAHAWKTKKPDATGVTDQGVKVVRRRRRLAKGRAA